MQRANTTSIFYKVLGSEATKEQTQILSKKMTKGVGSLTNYEAGRIIANHIMTYSYIEENNQDKYSHFENHVQDIEKALNIKNLPEGLSPKFYGMVLEDKHLNKFTIIKKAIRNKKALTSEEVNELENSFNIMKTHLSENYQESGESFTRYDNKGNALHFIPKEGRNGESWNSYEKLMKKIISQNKQPTPEPERDQAYSKVTTSPMPIAA